MADFVEGQPLIEAFPIWNNYEILKWFKKKIQINKEYFKKDKLRSKLDFWTWEKIGAKDKVRNRKCQWLYGKDQTKHILPFFK